MVHDDDPVTTGPDSPGSSPGATSPWAPPSGPVPPAPSSTAACACARTAADVPTGLDAVPARARTSADGPTGLGAASPRCRAAGAAGHHGSCGLRTGRGCPDRLRCAPAGGRPARCRPGAAAHPAAVRGPPHGRRGRSLVAVDAATAAHPPGTALGRRHRPRPASGAGGGGQRGGGRRAQRRSGPRRGAALGLGLGVVGLGCIAVGQPQRSRHPEPAGQGAALGGVDPERFRPRAATSTAPPAPA